MINKRFIMNDGYIIWGPIIITEIFLFIYLYKDSENIDIYLFLSGIFLFFYGLIFLYKIKNTFSWEKTTANLLSVDKSKVIILEPGVQDIAYEPSIKYKYKYNGNHYIGNTFSIIHNDFIFRNTKNISAEDKINSFLNLFIIDKHNITTWINPKKPNQSILQQGAEKKTVYKYVIIFCLGCINIVVSYLL